MKGKTYRYFKGDPLFPFGYGLSYTKFAYRNLVLPSEAETGKDVKLSVEVENVGGMAGEEVVQLYVKDLKASVPVPIRSLEGFQRIALKPGEKKQVEFTLTSKQFALVNGDGKLVVEPGDFEISVGGKQPGFTWSFRCRNNRRPIGEIEADRLAHVSAIDSSWNGREDAHPLQRIAASLSPQETNGVPWLCRSCQWLLPEARLAPLSPAENRASLWYVSARLG